MIVFYMLVHSVFYLRLRIYCEAESHKCVFAHLRYRNEFMMMLFYYILVLKLNKMKWIPRMTPPFLHLHAIVEFR